VPGFPKIPLNGPKPDRWPGIARHAAGKCRSPIRYHPDRRHGGHEFRIVNAIGLVLQIFPVPCQPPARDLRQQSDSGPYIHRIFSSFFRMVNNDSFPPAQNLLVQMQLMCQEITTCYKFNNLILNDKLYEERKVGKLQKITVKNIGRM
jgi:hypothetical protein